MAKGRDAAGTTDLTVGSPLKQILLFSLPIIAGSLLQQVYSFADTVVVGRLVSADALGAVGCTYSLNFLVLGFVQGACIGFSIPASQSFGAKDLDEFRRCLWNGTWICLVLSTVLTVGSVLLARPALVLMGTPDSLLQMATSYITVIFLGIPATVLYNYSAAILRAVGDSRHPFVFLVISCTVNVGIDLFCILVLKMGVVGSAVGSTLGEVLSAVLNCWWALARVPQTRTPDRSQMAPSAAHVRRQCIVGIPMGLEYCVSAVGAIVLQGAINALGAALVTAQTAGEKIRQMFTLPMESVGMAMASYAGQNFGAGRLDRVRKGLASGAVIQATWCVVSFVAIRLFGRQLVVFVLGAETDAQVLDAAVHYLQIISCFFILHGLLMVFRNTLQGMGFGVHAIVSGMCELAGRALGSAASLAGAGFLGVCLANPLAWGCALAYCMALVFWQIRQAERRASRTR